RCRRSNRCTSPEWPGRDFPVRLTLATPHPKFRWVSALFCALHPRGWAMAPDNLPVGKWWGLPPVFRRSRGPHRGGVACGNHLADVSVDLGFNVGIPAGADRNALRECSGLFLAPQCGLGIGDAFCGEGVVGIKGVTHSRISVMGLVLTLGT